ncbi:MAG: hypothetical protein ACK5N0_08025 [Synechococcaceae cyanobacterium]
MALGLFGLALAVGFLAVGLFRAGAVGASIFGHHHRDSAPLASPSELPIIQATMDLI